MAEDSRWATLMPLPKRIRGGAGRWVLPTSGLDVVGDEPFPRLTAALRGLGVPVDRAAADRAQLSLRVDPVVRELQRVRPDLRVQGYVLDVSPRGLSLVAESEAGLFYGIQTLSQLLSDSHALPAVRVVDWPDMAFRGVHCMLGCDMLNPKAMRRFVERMAQHKMNHLVLEYDDRFPWERHPALVHPSAFSKAQLRDLVQCGEEHFIEITPCLDSLGHAQCYLCHPEYAHLAEMPDRIHDLCATDPRSLVFIKDLWDEILEVHPTSRYAHITGDEVWYAGVGRSERRMKEIGKAGVFVDYYTDLSRWIIARGKVPIMWDDMIVKYPQALSRLPRDIVMCDWCYEGEDRAFQKHVHWKTTMEGTLPAARRRLLETYWHPDGDETRCANYPYTRFFSDQGFEVLGGSAASNTPHPYILPSLHHRFVNNKRFAMAVKAQQGLGLLVTYWSGFGPIEGAWAGVLAGAEYAWHTRNETEDAFGRRLGGRFLQMTSGEEAALVGLEDHLYLHSEEPRGFKTRMWAPREGAARIRRTLGDVRRRDPLNRDYKRMLEWQAEWNELLAHTSGVFNEINALSLGTGHDAVVDIRPWMNRGYADCLPTGAVRFELCAASTLVSGVKVRTLDPARHEGKSVIVTRGERNPRGPRRVKGIAVNRPAERLYFLYTGYDVVAGSHVADLVIRMADGARHTMPVVDGVNITDWHRGDRVPLPGAVLAWEGLYQYAYLAWWDNPNPEVEVATVDLEWAGNKGYVILAGLTARTSVDYGEDMAHVRALHARLERARAKIDPVCERLVRCWRNVLTPEELPQSAKRMPFRTLLEAWCDFYAERLRLKLPEGSAAGGRQRVVKRR